HVDARGLEERLVVRLDLDATLVEQAPDRAVGENHAAILRPSPARSLCSYAVTAGCGSVRVVATTRSIELKTAIPGPRSSEILERKARAIADPLSIYLPVVIEEGRGALVTDVDGNTFIDFTGGVG